jgi:CCR4-NOT complex subunit CAF16
MSFNKEYEHSVNVSDLYFTYGGPPIIDHLDLRLDAGNRCILVGANGAGKTTLLRILAGKRMIPGQIKVLGKDAFVDAPQVSINYCFFFVYTHWVYALLGCYLFRNRMG